MYWQENNNESYQIPDDVIDMQLQIKAPTLPVDHAWVLQQALQKELPWFTEQQSNNGLHLIHTADTGNGWERPSDPDALLHLSKRTKLVLRIHKESIEALKPLLGKTLDIAGHSLIIQKAKIRPLATTSIVFSRYIAVDPEQPENEFINDVVDYLKSHRLGFQKILAGMQHQIRIAKGVVHTRSLMIADLTHEDAVYLQQTGYGKHRTLGCGLFIPQKTM